MFLSNPSALRRYLAAFFLTNLGGQMLGVAVGWQVYTLTRRPLDLGYVGLAQFVPALFLSLPAGQLADRLDRARVVAVCDLVLGACALALARASSAGGVAPIYGILVVAGSARAFAGPAGQALVPELVPKEKLSRAVTWSSATWQVATIAGPAVGGALYGSGREVFVACAAVFAAASGLAFTLGPRRHALEPTAVSPRTVLAGLTYVRKSPVILGSITLDLFAVLFGGTTALLPVYAKDVLDVGPFGLGLLRSAPGIGAAATAIFLSARPLTRRAGPMFLACVALFGAATIVFGLSRSFGLSLASLFVLGAADMVSVVVRSTVVQLFAPHEMRGRVSAVNMMCVAASSELGELESGLTAAWLGVTPAIVLGGAATLAVVFAYARLFPELRAVAAWTRASREAPRGECAPGRVRRKL